MLFKPIVCSTTIQPPCVSEHTHKVHTGIIVAIICCAVLFSITTAIMLHQFYKIYIAEKVLNHNTVLQKSSALPSVITALAVFFGACMIVLMLVSNHYLNKDIHTHNEQMKYLMQAQDLLSTVTPMTNNRNVMELSLDITRQYAAKYSDWKQASVSMRDFIVQYLKQYDFRMKLDALEAERQIALATACRQNGFDYYQLIEQLEQVYGVPLQDIPAIQQKLLQPATLHHTLDQLPTFISYLKGNNLYLTLQKCMPILAYDNDVRTNLAVLANTEILLDAIIKLI
jgi:flagellar basal body-associated protein FliL